MKTSTAKTTSFSKCLFVVSILFFNFQFSILRAQITTIAWTTANSTCYGSNGGNAMTNPSGGTAPYTYSWSNGSSTVSTSNPTGAILSAGSYTVTVLDNNSLSASASISIVQPADSLSMSIATYANACFGGTGSITANAANGGNLTYFDLHDFNGTNGATPLATLTPFGTTFYGLARAGGAHNDGCIFSYNSTNDVYTDLFDFDGANGANPQNTSLTLVGTTFYGMSRLGGANGDGCIFSFNTVGNVYTDLLDFNGTNGKDPGAYLTLSGTILYGTAFGGAHNDGCIFSFNTVGNVYTDLFDFSGANGQNPHSLILSGTTLYGMTQTGGANGVGCIFSFNTTGNVCNDLLDFNGTNGRIPQGHLLLSGSILYGMTAQGGANSVGLIFSLDTNGSGYTDLLDFDYTNGASPNGSLIISGATLYGMTGQGGVNTDGNVFSIDTDGSNFIDLLDFNFTNGNLPFGDLTLSGNTLYGMTEQGGAHGDGVIFSQSINTGYSYVWSPSGGTNLTASNLSAGTYTITATDANGCNASASATITQAASALAVGNPMQISPNTLCIGGNGSAVSAIPTGGAAPYTYQWNGGPANSNDTITGLTTGTYAVNITDANGCTVISDSVTVTQTASTLAVDNPTQISPNTLCIGGNGVAVSAIPIGGYAPYTYQWNGGSSSLNDSIAGLTTGIYAVNITDANGCTVISDSITISQAASTLAVGNPIASSNLSCNGGNNGSAISAIPTGGYPPYTYQWNGGPYSSSNTITGLTAGIYTVTVTDVNGCTINSSSPATITQPAVLAINIASQTNILCYGGTGAATASSATGGVAPYTYSWAPSGGSNLTISNLTPNSYTITVTDANGCNGSASANIITVASSAVSISLASETYPLCNGGTGSANATSASGGANPYKVYKDMHDFNSPNGENPYDGTLTALGTTLYGMTYYGGAYDAGVIFSFDTVSKVYTDLLDFNYSNGAHPSGSLIISGTTLYGMTQQGGVNGVGNVFSFNTAGNIYTELLDFNYSNGSYPYGSLILSGNMLYGMTAYGGGDGVGNVFSLDTTGTIYTDLFDFNYSNGAYPDGSLLLSGNMLYGMTAYGGGDGVGNVFSLDTTGSTFTELLDFDGANGSQPNGSLILSGTTLYGTTSQGGVNGVGNIFSFNTNGNTYTDLLDFNVTNGSGPGSLLLSGATLYGMTELGGVNGEGLIYSFNTNGNIYTDLLDFNGTNGRTPQGSLIISGSTMYGMTESGGVNNSGTIFSNNLTPYSYVWSPTGGTNLNASNLTAGTYTITATDVSGCNGSASVTITQPAVLGVTIASQTNVACNGGTGNATSNATGGTIPYTYSWSSGGGTNSIATALSAGSYTITATDNNNCTATASVTITQPATVLGITIASQSNVLCNGGTGSATSNTATGGTTPYTYSWSGGGGTNLTATLSAGSYTITATDNNSCTATASVVITQPGTILGITIASQTNVPCNGGTGSATANIATGGTTPYTYSWNGGGGTNLTASNLTAGSYTITATDNNNCTATASVTITQPASALGITIASQTNVHCNGGAAKVTANVATGGTTPYTYSWSGGGGTNLTTNFLTSGSYTITATDVNGCIATASATITQPPLLAITLATQTNILCFGETGTITANAATGGVSPYTYLWIPGGGTNLTASNLNAGIYTLRVTDANGCIASVNTNITSPAAAVGIAIASQTSDLCHGSNSGSATADTATGGIGAYQDLVDFHTINGSDPYGSLLSSGNLLYGMTSTGGAYREGNIFSYNKTTKSTIDLLDFSGTNGNRPWGSLIQSGNILYGMTRGGGLYGEGVLFSFDTSTNTCTDLWDFDGIYGESPDGDLTLVGNKLYGMAQGGGAYGEGVVFSYNLTDSTYTDLLDFGNFSNGNGYTPMGSLIFSGTSLYGMTKYGGANGAGVIFSLDTIGNVYTDLLDFNITDGASPSGSLVLSGTTLYGMAFDGGAYNTGNIFSLNIIGNVFTDLFDFNGTDGIEPLGSLTISGNTLYGMTQGGGAYNYGCMFSFNTTGNIYKDLLDFNYANGGEPQYNSLTLSGSSLYGMTEGGGAYGLGVLFSYNTASPYSYSWSPSGGTNLTASNLSAGTYTITATDVNGCNATATVTITQPNVLSPNVTVTNIHCGGGSNGSALSTPTGGTSPYTYSWSGGGSNAVKTGLSAGTYSLTVTDNRGCSASASITITQPTSALYSGIYLAHQQTCVLGYLTVTPGGGTAPYTYLWSANTGSQTSVTATGLSAGTYSVLVTDAGGCTSNTSSTIAYKPLYDSVKSVVNNLCNNGASGSVSIGVRGGRAPYTYSWNNGGTGSGISYQSDGTYSVTITDADGCTATASATITSPPLLTVNLVSMTAPSCHSGSNGSITVSASGGVTPYTYDWTPNVGTTATVTGLLARGYTILVKDHNGCTAQLNLTLTQPTAVTTTISRSGCSLTANPSGGTSPYSYSWTTGATTASITESNGTYTVTTTDHHGCSVTASGTITGCIVASEEPRSPIKSDVNTIDSVASDITLYPNPSTGQFTIAGLEAAMSIEIYDYTGRKISTISASNNSIQLNISNQANGLYLIRILSKDGTLVSQKKLVKTR